MRKSRTIMQARWGKVEHSSIFIGPKSDHCLALPVPESLTGLVELCCEDRTHGLKKVAVGPAVSHAKGVGAEVVAGGKGSSTHEDLSLNIKGRRGRERAWGRRAWACLGGQWWWWWWWKSCWSFCFELKLLNESKHSIPWVCCVFGNVFITKQSVANYENINLMLTKQACLHPHCIGPRLAINTKSVLQL